MNFEFFFFLILSSYICLYCDAFKSSEYFVNPFYGYCTDVNRLTSEDEIYNFTLDAGYENNHYEIIYNTTFDNLKKISLNLTENYNITNDIIPPGFCFLTYTTDHSSELYSGCLCPTLNASITFDLTNDYFFYNSTNKEINDTTLYENVVVDRRPIIRTRTQEMQLIAIFDVIRPKGYFDISYSNSFVHSCHFASENNNDEVIINEINIMSPDEKLNFLKNDIVYNSYTRLLMKKSEVPDPSLIKSFYFIEDYDHKPNFMIQTIHDELNGPEFEFHEHLHFCGLLKTSEKLVDSEDDDNSLTEYRLLVDVFSYNNSGCIETQSIWVLFIMCVIILTINGDIYGHIFDI